MFRRLPLLVAIFVFLFGSSSLVIAAVRPATTWRQNLEVKRQEATAAIRQKQVQLKETAKARWQELKDTRQAKLAELKNAVQEKREEVKAKIQGLRNERKRQVIERIQTKLGQINERRTVHFLNVLERLDSILDKIQSRMEEARASGKDVTAIESALSEARMAIASARSGVEVQKAKTYPITVNDETTARNDVGVAAKNLEADLKVTRTLVEAARAAVQAVFQQIKTVVTDSNSAAVDAE